MCYYYTCKRFQPTLPARGATWGGQGICLIAKRFQPTLPARGATIAAAIDAGDNLISTHAPRTGSDKQSGATTAANGAFQPTLPARGATPPLSQRKHLTPYFNPRSPHGERLGRPSCIAPSEYFNPRSPHGERRINDITRFAGLVFQPTLPARGATLSGWHCHDRRRHFNPRSPHGERLNRLCGMRDLRAISTHAPRTGSDRKCRSDPRLLQDFNPRSPHGERPDVRRGRTAPPQFQPTLPARGATWHTAALDIITV